MKCENNSNDSLRIDARSRTRWEDAITQENIDQMKKRIRIGSRVIWRVLVGNAENTVAQYPTELKKLKVIGKYRYVVTARDENTGLIYSMTWKELMMDERRRGNH